MNDVSHDFNFQKGNLIYVTHITPLKAVILFEMLLLCSLGIQLANYIRNLNNSMVLCLLSVAQTFILIFSLVCYSNICNRLSETNAPEHRVQTSLKRCGLKFSSR